MAFHLVIDREAAQPLYAQIAAQIRQAIRAGELPIETRLPSIRTLAQQAGVTRLTVETAYNDLIADGWLITRAGLGTFVAAAAQPDALIQRVQYAPTPASALEDMPYIHAINIVRSLAYAEPDTSLVSLNLLWRYLKDIRSDDAEMLRYGSPQGDGFLRAMLVDGLRERGIESLPDEIIVTSGATQGLALLIQTLLRPGDVVAVEEPTHMGLLHALRSLGMQPVGVPMDEDGLRLDSLEQIMIQYKPRILHTCPGFHNPTGYQMSAERRVRLLELARQHQMLIAEDDVYGLLGYDGAIQPALKSLDREGRVIYLSSFSKLLFPSLRVGYMVAPEPLRQHMLQLRQANDMAGQTFLQRALAQFIQSGELRRHVSQVVPIYRQRRDALLQALATWMPAGATYTRPQGGFSCLLQLPAGINEAEVCRDALRQGFAFTQGSAFLTRGSGGYLRICFGSQPPEIIREAMRVLGSVLKR